jgi:hypothetical protein
MLTKTDTLTDHERASLPLPDDDYMPSDEEQRIMQAASLRVRRRLSPGLVWSVEPRHP